MFPTKLARNIPLRKSAGEECQRCLPRALHSTSRNNYRKVNLSPHKPFKRTFGINHSVFSKSSVNMITRFLTSVSTAFSPFNPKSGKTARNFLAMLPPNARTTMTINIKMLPKADAAKPALLSLTFKDGKEMKLDLDQLKIKDIMQEVDRHSRMLGRQEELSG
ncbi:hypothetical protein BDV97DRAFT_347124 [Delphinella strobiligena]|nr:hypothetical protein BDV97DRAFT_347124 [Delphinella strobiligena]